MEKRHWIAHFEEETLEDILGPDDDPNDYDEDELSLEYSVVLSSNTHGLRSWGWGGKDKIILFDQTLNGKEEREWGKRVTRAVADMLNKEGF